MLDGWEAHSYATISSPLDVYFWGRDMGCQHFYLYFDKNERKLHCMRNNDSSLRPIPKNLTGELKTIIRGGHSTFHTTFKF